MVNSILFGEFLYNRLSTDSGITSYVDNRIYPLVIIDDVANPFIVFYRNNLESVADKNGVFEDSVNYSVAVVADSYAQSCQIANAVRQRLEFKKVSGTDMVVFDSHLTNVQENYIADSYVQTLTFQCVIH